jgi:hypothetical protein
MMEYIIIYPLSENIALHQIILIINRVVVVFQQLHLENIHNSFDKITL